MASILQDPASGCTDDHILVVDDAGGYDNLAWVSVGGHLVYIRQDEDGKLVVRAGPADNSDVLYGEITSL